jgi:hypothetical protein
VKINKREPGVHTLDYIWKEISVEPGFLTALQNSQQVKQESEDDTERREEYLDALERVSLSIQTFFTLNILTEKELSTLYRNFYLGMSVGEIAKEDGVSRGAVCAREVGDSREEKDGKHGSRKRLGALGKLKQYLIQENMEDILIILRK